MNNKTIIGILGPTASGKTKYAVALAKELDAEIISLDSRQVYKELNLGVGKDIEEYTIDGITIPYHLISHISLDDQYHIDRFKKDFDTAYNDIINRGKRVIACGGTGLYFDVSLNNRAFTSIAINEQLREELKNKSLEELHEIFNSIHKDRSHSFDLSTKKRSIRAIEIASSEEYYTINKSQESKYEFELYGLMIDKKELNKKIDERLESRLIRGMVQEVEELLNKGFTAERLIYLGLEYKFITQYLLAEMSYEEMKKKLAIAIHQFSKRQMTFFRKLEKDGHVIKWLEAGSL
ncbi:MAG: tRNA (adenosine(37)-N6)-dimethylallyltransferase MiaA [bacterium]|jgi:tRNA dimethylallyltransferase